MYPAPALELHRSLGNRDTWRSNITDMVFHRLFSAVLVASAAITNSSAYVAMPSSYSKIVNTSHKTTTRLDAALLPSVVTKLSPPLRNTIVLSTAVSAAAVSIYRNHKKKGLPDASCSAPLPEGSLGCPILGNIEFYTKQGSWKKVPANSFVGKPTR